MLRFLVLLGSLALLPAVVALSPPACGSECTIEAASFPGYTPGLAVVPSGSSVSFVSTDITHITQDMRTLGSDVCFTVIHAPDDEPTPVRFDVADGALFATTDGASVECANALGAEAAFALPYFCTIHPTMRGVLVVTA